MISKKEIKFIRSLKLKKYRYKERSFIVEGIKNVRELFDSDFSIDLLTGTEKFIQDSPDLVTNAGDKFREISIRDMESISTFQTNETCLAVSTMREAQQPEDKSLLFALESVKDPGNLGTIIRTLDWYGFSGLICSEDCADFYNPKTLAATMGSFSRIIPFITDLKSYITKTQRPIIGAQMQGTPVNEFSFPANGIIVMGSESHGLSKAMQELLTDSVTIPRFGQAESLNVAMATTAICHSIRLG